MDWRIRGGALGALPPLLLLLMMCLQGSAEKSKFYYMQSLCKNHFLQQLYRKIDGAVLWSQNERNLDCVITFQTHSILQRFMLRFDMLQLDCNDHLLVYDGAHAVGTHKADLSCRNTKQSVGAIFTRTNFVTLKYVTDGWGTESNGFKLVITAVKDPKHGCKDFRCNLREFCISGDLMCDGVNHCADGSDETSSPLCQNQDTSTILGLELPWFVVAAVSLALVLCAFAAAIALCICRRSRPNQNANSQLQHQQLTKKMPRKKIRRFGWGCGLRIATNVRIKRFCGKAAAVAAAAAAAGDAAPAAPAAAPAAAANDGAAGKLAAPCGAGRGGAGAPLPQGPGRALRPGPPAAAAPHKDEWFV